MLSSMNFHYINDETIDNGTMQVITGLNSLPQSYSNKLPGFGSCIFSTTTKKDMLIIMNMHSLCKIILYHIEL